MKIILICFIKIILNQSFVKNANVMLIKIGLTKMKLSKFITIFTRNIMGWKNFNRIFSLKKKEYTQNY